MAALRIVRLLAAGALAASAGVAVIASPASAVDVSTEVGLRAAFADTAETSIVLTADIDLTDCGAGQLTRPAAAAALTLSGAFTITQTCAGARVIGTAGATGALTVDDVTITGGRLTDPTSANGGGINWAGAVTLNRATITDNTATAPFGGLGGGIFASGVVTVNQSTISDNSALSNGDFGALGGALVSNGGATITDSTLADNTAGGGAEFGGTGGAIFGNSNITLIRSTVSGNQALQSTDTTSGGNGGGVVINADLTVINSTITSNVATGATSSNGGIAAGGDMTIAYSTIVGNSAATAANVQSLNSDPEFGTDSIFASVVSDPLGGGTNCGAGSDAAASQGYNYSTDASCNFASTGDVQSGADPLVGPLANNGGLTLTRLPSATSPLLDRIPSADCQDGNGTGITTDQRGITRPQGVGCDVGAVEVVVLVPVIPGTPGTSTEPAAVLVTPRFTG